MKNVIVNRAKFDIMPDNMQVHKGKAVLCIITGEVFKSAKEAANYYNLNYNSLIGHLAGKYKTVGGSVGRGRKKNGLKFCYIAEMGYKANDISKYIIELKKTADESISREKMSRIVYEVLKLVEADREAKQEYVKQANERAEKIDAQIQSILAIMPNLQVIG